MSSFIDNPVVSSLASSLGLGGLTQAGSNPLVSSAAPAVAPKVTPTHSQPNQPEYKQARFFDPRTPQSPGGFRGSGAMPTEPGAMSPDVQNSPTVSDLLNHFGVHPQQSVDPGLFIHSQDAWANHPVVSGILDGLMGGLANTRGSDTLGEGLSNVAQGLAATHDQKVAHINAQLQMPYQQAMTVASLQDQASKQAQEEAQQKYNLAHAGMMDNYWSGKNTVQQTTNAGKEAVAGITADGRAKVAAARPVGMDVQTFNSLVKKHLSDTLPIGGQPSDDDLASATQLALKEVNDTKETSKTQGAVNTAKGTLAPKIALKSAAPGSSAAAMISAGKNANPVAKATYADADKDVQAIDKMKPSELGALINRPFALPNDPAIQAERARRVAVRDAARSNLAPAGSKPSSTYSPNNPFAK